LAAEPVNYGYKREHDANPVHGWAYWFNNMFECPLEAVGYRLKDAL
jgi:hypothetical protein